MGKVKLNGKTKSHITAACCTQYWDFNVRKRDRAANENKKQNQSERARTCQYFSLFAVNEIAVCTRMQVSSNTER